MDSSRHPLLLNNNDEETLSAGDDGSHVQQKSLQIYDWLGRPLSPQNKSSHGGRKTLYFSLGTICLWYTAYFGMFFNMVLFFRNVLGEGSGAAANDTNNWLGTMFLSSLLGSFIAESYLGRLWACALFQSIALTGMAFMTLATSILVYGGSSSTAEVVFFYISFYLVSIGCGGFQPNLQSLGADQFDTEGEKATFFTRYLVLNNLGIALGDTVIVYIVTSKGWVFGFSMCTIVGLMGLTLFLCGFPLFRQYKNNGNPYTRAIRVIVAAVRKWRLKLPSDSSLLYEEEKGHNRQHLKHTDNLRWLDKAAIIDEETAAMAHQVQTPIHDKLPIHSQVSRHQDQRCVNTDRINEDSNIKDGINRHYIKHGIMKDGWMLSSVTEVEEMKAVLRLVPVWAASIFFNTVYSQAGTLMIEEGETMDTTFFSFTMEPATMNMFNILAVVLLPPFYNIVIVPFARRFTGMPRGLSPLQRTAAGYVLCIISLSLAAILEGIRVRRANAGLSAPSIFWQVPEFVLLGTAQFLAGIGQLEFFYTYSPLSLRSLGSAFCLTCIALGDYVSSLLVTVVTFVTTRGGGEGWIASADLNDGHLDYFFWLMAGLAFLNLLFFLACARSFMKQKSEVEECAS